MFYTEETKIENAKHDKGIIARIVKDVEDGPIRPASEPEIIIQGKSPIAKYTEARMRIVREGEINEHIQ